MNISFKKDINRSYMVIEKVEEFSANDFMMKMLSDNRISGLLPVGYENINGQYNLLYDISSKQAFSRSFETRKLSFRQVKALLFSLKSLLRSLEEYLLDADNIMLKQECIFVDPEGEKYEYCYFPYYHGDLLLEMRELFNRMLSMVDYEDDRAVRLVYEVHSEMQNENVTMDALLEACYRILKDPPEKEADPEEPEILMIEETEGPEAPRARPVLLPPEAPEVYDPEPQISFLERFRYYVKGRKFLEVLEDLNNGELREKILQCGPAPEISPPFTGTLPPVQVSEERKRLLPEERSASRQVSRIPEAFAEEILYSAGSGEGTVLLGQCGQDNHRLVGRNSRQGEGFVITEYPYTIGKKEGKGWAYISEPTVSRMHARIYCDKGRYFIEDLNSTNGTYLNEQRLSAYTKNRLNPGDILRFAGEEFCFQ